AAVAAAGTRTDLVLLDEDDTGALARGVVSGGQAGEAAADDHHVRLVGQVLAGAVGQGGCGVEPVGDLLHGVRPLSLCRLSCLPCLPCLSCLSCVPGPPSRRQQPSSFGRPVRSGSSSYGW